MYKKLVLIIPPSPWLLSDRDQPFLGALYISSYLKSSGFEVQVYDLAGVPEEHWHIPVGSIYGVTGTSPQFPWMKKIIQILKSREPHKSVVVGGVHATVYPEHILENTEADFCVIGEGEITMFHMMTDYSVEHIPGIVGKGFATEKRGSISSLDLLPPPDRESIDYFDYLRPQTYKYLADEREASIITGRGCPYHCAYCASPKIWGGKIRLRSAQNVAKELKYLKDRYDIGLCNFVDDTFILDKKRIYEICELIKDLGIKWFFLTRVDHVDYELFLKMKEAGCVSVTFGFETGSDRILKAIKKNTTVAQAKEAIRISKKAGFKIRGQMMVGLPFEEDEDIKTTAQFIKDIPEVDTIGLHVFKPFPGCDVWEHPEQYNFEIDKNTDFSDYHTIGRPGEQLSENPKVQERYDYLKDTIGNRSIEHFGGLDA